MTKHCNALFLCHFLVQFFICAIFSAPFRKHTHPMLTEFWQTKTSVVIFCKLFWTFFPPSSNVAHILTTSFHLIFKGRHNVKSLKKATLLWFWFFDFQLSFSSILLGRKTLAVENFISMSYHYTGPCFLFIFLDALASLKTMFKIKWLIK